MQCRLGRWRQASRFLPLWHVGHGFVQDARGSIDNESNDQYPANNHAGECGQENAEPFSDLVGRHRDNREYYRDAQEKEAQTEYGDGADACDYANPARFDSR